MTVVAPMPHQLPAFSRSEPEICLCTGLGGGKTYAGSRWVLARAVAFPESLHLVTINSYTQAQDVVIPALDEALDELAIPHRWHSKRQTPTLYLLLGGIEAEIRVRSTVKYDSLRGAEYGSWWADEIRDADKRAIPVILARLRCRHADVPSLLWTTTPNGHDFIHKRFASGGKIVEEFDSNGFPCRVWKAHPDRVMVQADTRANVHLGESYGQTLEDAMDEKMLRQERGAEFVAMGNRVYHAFDWQKHRSKRAVYVPGDPLGIALDFNPHKMSAVLAQERRGVTMIVDEICATSGGTPAVIAEFARRYPQLIDGEGVTLYGDSSGYNPDTREGVSDYALWSEAIPDLVIRVPRANGRVRDRVNAVNSRCESGGKVRMLINPRCHETLADLEQNAWSEKVSTDIDKKDAERTHFGDALGYYVVTEHPVRRKIDAARRNARLAALPIH